MQENDFKARCPHCQTPVQNWRDLYLSKRYICGNKKCQLGFILIKVPTSIMEMDFSSL